MRVHLAAGLLAIAAAAGGCYASAGYSTGYVAPAPVYTSTATVTVDTYEPDLVDVGGGVRVIADYDEPVFYTDNYYWRFYGGTWYRSNAYNGGWVVYNDIPYSVRRIDRPHAYVRYRPSGYVPRARRDPSYNRGNRGGYRPAPQPAVRDHRTYDRGGGYRPAPQPAVRDHRTHDRGGYRQPAPQPAVRDHRTYDRPAPRQAPQPQPAVRDHRTHDRPARPAPAAQPARPAPAVRDHRQDRRDDRRDDRDDRRDTRVRDHRR
jgi:hypothetical protein